MNKKNVKRGLMPYLFLIVFVCIVYFVFSSLNQKEHKLSYDEFVKELNANNIVELEITPKERAVIYELKGKLKGYEKDETFTAQAPFSSEVIAEIIAQLTKKSYRRIVCMIFLLSSFCTFKYNITFKSDIIT